MVLESRGHTRDLTTQLRGELLASNTLGLSAFEMSRFQQCPCLLIDLQTKSP